MLTIKTNKNNCKISYIPLNISSITTGDTVYDDITITTDGSSKIKDNDTVSFIRRDGESISYFNDAEVKDIISDTTFTVDGFGKYTIEVNGYKPSFVKYSNNISKIDYKSKIYTTNLEYQTIEITGNTLEVNDVLKIYSSVSIDEITGIFISSEVTSISDNSFNGCENLSEISVAVNNRIYTAENDVLFNKDKTALIYYPPQKTSSSYSIPATVKKINNNAFFGVVNLTNVTIPSFVDVIGNNTFSGCSNLISVICKPINPPIITDTTFDKLVLEKIYVKDEQVRRYKTAWKKLKSKIEGDEDIIDDIEINPKNTRLYLTNGTIVEITGSTLESWISENYADSLCAVEIGTIVKTIGYYTFGGCYLLSSVTIPNSVNAIGDYAFNNCTGLTQDIVIPDSVTSIGDYAFNNCKNIQHIYIGNGIKKIGDVAFYNISNTCNIYCESKEPPTLGSSKVFPTTCLIYVPGDVLNIYKGCYMFPNSLSSLTDATIECYICLNTNEHIFITNKDEINARRSYLWSEEDHKYKYDGAITMCDGDFYIFDNIFLVQNSGNTYPVRNNNVLNITATTAGDEPVLLTNCLIGADYDGKDDKYHIYIPYDENIGFTKELEDRLSVTTFTTDDIRFLFDGSNQMAFGCELQPSAHIDKVCGNIEVDFSVNDSFEVNLHHDEQVSNYIEKIKNESINKIIDYERYPYTPMYYDKEIPETENGERVTADRYFMEHSNEIDDDLKRVDEIKFRLHFRVKEFTLYDEDGLVIPTNGDTGNTDYVDFGTWDTDDNEYWNNYELRSDHKALVPVYKNNSIYADLLGYLGFTDDDVYYQKDALKKSFIRLSFYDSKNRETQKLLYYSTIYFDTNVLSANYINNLTAWNEHEEYSPQFNQLVFAYDIKKFGNNTTPLTAEMSCTDKYDNSSSSDGFYLHLFNKLVSGNTCTPIYMKVEFNNAKFGKTIPMIRPIFNSSNKKISPTNTSFPREYMKAKKNASGDTYNWVDMNTLLQDMYIKIFIKYDFKLHQFVWFVPQSKDDNINNVLKFDLFEPRVKGYDFGSYDYLEGNDAGYGTIDGRPNWYIEGSGFNDNHEWMTEDGHTESEWAEEYDGCCLSTTATTLPGENMLDGTKLFNKHSIKYITHIWIDGMMAISAEVYDEETERYKTTNFQLPDIPFTGYTSSSWFIWEPETTKETWNDRSSSWYIGDVTPKKIHRVNYYFRTNKEDQVKLIDELYLGINGEEKTKEITEDLCRRLKNEVPLVPSETLPRGMFSRIRSLRCVNVIKNGNKHFTTIGNGAFNYCQNLIKFNIEEDALDIIGKNCFAGCRSLKTVSLSNTKIILREAFQGCCTLAKVIFNTERDNSIKYIGCGAFGYTKIRTIHIPNTILRIGNSAFRRCYQLNSFNIDGNTSLLTVGKRIFADCAILKYNLVMAAGESRYTYSGGVPYIIRYFLNNQTNVIFYDTFRHEYVSLLVSAEYDRGKIMYHFKDNEYYTYLRRKQTDVMNFNNWYWILF